ncbi:leucine-rich repeat domain-containing protein [Candidatus Palauibacter sp.]|uniref:leucine-rich repeat domain-containing protein n=1 Tax=Candidatus Palauibacter sp. TaxID=3101350 RepID=UPI003B02E9E0
MPPELGNLPNLVDLDLSWNQLTGSIPPALGSLSALSVLRLDYNGLTGPSPSELGNPASLRYLSLAGNEVRAHPFGAWQTRPPQHSVAYGERLVRPHSLRTR